MRTRKAALDIDPALLNTEVETSVRGSAVNWRHYTCKLVTPMLGGGVTAGEVDREMPIRATAIRGQLRYWWRLLNRKLDSRDLFAAERAIWGGLGDSDLAASKALVTVEGCSLLAVEVAGHFPAKEGGHKGTLEWKEWAQPYALFPAQGKVERGEITESPRMLAREGLAWTLRVGFRDLPSDAAKQAEIVNGVTEAIRWWATFGGVGARTRRGLGALEITSADVEPFAYVSKAEVEQAGLKLNLKLPENSAIAAWKLAIDALRSFRQGRGVGRNAPNPDSRSPAGRSLWTEPDAIRRMVGSPSVRHQPTHLAGNLFPRAAFGLPIIFHFKDSDDALDSELSPMTCDQRHDRMGSPLILRPYRGSQGKWHPAVLSLPDEHVWSMGLELRNSGKGRNRGLPRKLPSGSWWPANATEKGAKAALILPLAGRGTEALSAFLAYFTPVAAVAAATPLATPAQEEKWEKSQIKYNDRNGSVTATGPNNRTAIAIQGKGQEIWNGLSSAARTKIARGFFHAVAVVEGKNLLRVEEKQ